MIVLPSVLYWNSSNDISITYPSDSTQTSVSIQVVVTPTGGQDIRLWDTLTPG